MATLAVQALAAAAKQLGAENRQFYEEDKRLTRILRATYRSSLSTPVHSLGVKDTLEIWKLLARIDTRVVLAGSPESIALGKDQQRLIAKALDAHPQPISLVQRRYLCSWAMENRHRLRIDYWDQRSPWLSFPSVQGWQVVSPVPMRPRSTTIHAFSCRLTNLGIHFYSEPLSEKNLRRFMR